jgi:hypothetical protein
LDWGLAADLAVGGVCGWIQGFSESAEMASGDPAAEAADNQIQLGSVHTASFPALLQRLRISLAVTTYQAGKLVLLRSNAGHLNTHFCGFPKPMGLALRGPQLAVGTRNSIVEFHANEAAAVFAGAADSCDRCYVQRLSHVTGNIQIHEMEWVGDELWFVNTLFSCLAVRSSVHSFEPRWQPSFISALAPEDRCHLNGLGLRDGEIRYVTALGRSDTAGGWRPGKKDGGLLLAVCRCRIHLAGIGIDCGCWNRERGLWERLISRAVVMRQQRLFPDLLAVLISAVEWRLWVCLRYVNPLCSAGFRLRHRVGSGFVEWRQWIWRLVNCRGG